MIRRVDHDRVRVALTAGRTIVDLDHHLMGYIPVYGCPMRGEPEMSRVHTRAPDLGEHTREVLDEPGYTEAEIEELEAGGAFDGQPGVAHAETAS